MTTFSDTQRNVQPLFRNAHVWHVSRILLAIAATLYRWQSQAAQRRILAGLSDHQLKDLGLSRADAAGEAAKFFWQG